MDWITPYAVILVVTYNALNLIIGPFLIGKPAKVYTPGAYLVSASAAVTAIFVAGRAMSWW